VYFCNNRESNKEESEANVQFFVKKKTKKRASPEAPQRLSPLLDAQSQPSPGRPSTNHRGGLSGTSPRRAPLSRTIFSFDPFFLTMNAIQRFGKCWGRVPSKAFGRVPNILPKRCIVRAGKSGSKVRDEKTDDPTLEKAK
jgi:hypothetical protein